MLIVIELTLVVAFLMVWKGVSLILEDKVLIPARIRREREVRAELDAEVSIPTVAASRLGRGRAA